MATVDILRLDENKSCQEMLSRYGDNHPQKEHVLLSQTVLKINERGKQQTRILLLTDKALYNLKQNNIKSCQRRINFHLIECISISIKSNEFTIHVPTEYDYRYKTIKPSDKHIITETLAKLCNVSINKLHFRDMRKFTIYKSAAQKLSVQQRRNKLKCYSQITMKPNENPNKPGNILMLSDSKITDSNRDLISNFLDNIRLKDELFIYGYIRQNVINKYNIQIPSIVIDYCLKYLFIKTISCNANVVIACNEQDEQIEDNCRKSIMFGDDSLFMRMLYGSYLVECDKYNKMKTFMWQLRVTQFDESDGSIFIGIAHDIENENGIGYVTGGRNNWAFYIYKFYNGDTQVIGNMLSRFEQGDYIDVILDLMKNVLIFIVNCNKMHVVTNIMSKNDEKYRLSVMLSNGSVELTDFKIFVGSFREYQKAQHKKIEYDIKYY